MMKEEQAYIKQVLAGDVAMYRPLVERYQTGLIIHCENILKNREDAEDIAQDTFVKAYKELAKFEIDKARFSTWIYKIATNLCLDYLRKNKKKVTTNDIEQYMEINTPRYAEDNDSKLLRQHIDELEPSKYASIVKGYYWEGKSYQTLADEYHTSTGTIGTWLTRAKAQLKEKLS